MELSLRQPTANNIRVLTIIPQGRSSKSVPCSIQTVSLTDFTPEYQKHISSLDPAARKTDILTSWINLSSPVISKQGKRTTRKRDVFANLLSSRRSKLTLPGLPFHTSCRYRWGDFVSLSYVLGDSSVTREILVDGRSVPVTENLEAVLRTFSGSSNFNAHCKLWVDALCINQEDKDERSHHVATMGNMYATAWTVVVWLGKASEDSDKAISLIEILAGCYGDHRQGEKLALPLAENPSHFGVGYWLALNNFLKRGFWSRLWDIQESS
ncbi:MAG: hypothetical protein MMC33_000864 [Icmadophila ericetorum]|nr:hypothetical protein [Icmadophila ericetorum]